MNKRIKISMKFVDAMHWSHRVFFSRSSFFVTHCSSVDEERWTRKARMHVSQGDGLDQNCSGKTFSTPIRRSENEWIFVDDKAMRKEKEANIRSLNGLSLITANARSFNGERKMNAVLLLGQAGERRHFRPTKRSPSKNGRQMIQASFLGWSFLFPLALVNATTFPPLFIWPAIEDRLSIVPICWSVEDDPGGTLFNDRISSSRIFSFAYFLQSHVDLQLFPRRSSPLLFFSNIETNSNENKLGQNIDRDQLVHADAHVLRRWNEKTTLHHSLPATKTFSIGNPRAKATFRLSNQKKNIELKRRSPFDRCLSSTEFDRKRWRSSSAYTLSFFQRKRRSEYLLNFLRFSSLKISSSVDECAPESNPMNRLFTLLKKTHVRQVERKKKVFFHSTNEQWRRKSSHQIDATLSLFIWSNLSLLYRWSDEILRRI